MNGRLKLHIALWFFPLVGFILGGCEKSDDSDITGESAAPVSVYAHVLTDRGYENGVGVCYISVYNTLEVPYVTFNGEECEYSPPTFSLQFPALGTGDTINIHIDALNFAGEPVSGDYAWTLPGVPELYGVVNDTFHISEPCSLTLHWHEVEGVEEYNLYFDLFYSWRIGYDYGWASRTVDTTVSGTSVTIPKEFLFPDTSVLDYITDGNGRIEVTAYAGNTEPGDSSCFSGGIVGFVKVEICSPAYEVALDIGSRKLARE